MNQGRIRVILADDELVARKRLSRLLSAMPDIELAGQCENGEQLLAMLEEVRADLLFLDIQMPGLDGLEVGALLPAHGPHVVYVTAHSQHALEAFEVGAADYIVKPIQPQRLRATIERLRPMLPARHSTSRLALPTHNGIQFVDSHTIHYAYYDGTLVTLISDGAQVVTTHSLTELQAQLEGSNFLRVHRRYLLNLDKVQRMKLLDSGGYMAETIDGDTVPVSRQVARELRRRFGV